MVISRRTAGTLFIGGALALTLGSLVYPTVLGVQKVSTSSDRVIANPATGPLTEADRDFVVQVRAAGLWEYSVGELALQKGTTKAVRTAGEHLIDGHASLDASSRATALQLNITLPNEPSTQQQGFVTQLKADSRKQFGTDMATILRATNGQLLTTVASVRTTTKNSLIRTLAGQANDTVMDLIKIVEKTGLVDFDQALAQQTATSTLPSEDTTPPPPDAGRPQVTLTPRTKSTTAPSASAG